MASTCLYHVLATTSWHAPDDSADSVLGDQGLSELCLLWYLKVSDAPIPSHRQFDKLPVCLSVCLSVCLCAACLCTLYLLHFAEQSSTGLGGCIAKATGQRKCSQQFPMLICSRDVSTNNTHCYGHYVLFYMQDIRLLGMVSVDVLCSQTTENRGP